MMEPKPTPSPPPGSEALFEPPLKHQAWKEVARLANALQVSDETKTTLDKLCKIVYLLYPEAELPAGYDTYHSLQKHIEPVMVSTILAWQGARYLSHNGIAKLNIHNGRLVGDEFEDQPAGVLDEKDLEIMFATMMIHDLGQRHHVENGKLVRLNKITYKDHEAEAMKLADFLLTKERGFNFDEVDLMRIKYGIALTQISDQENKLSKETARSFYDRMDPILNAGLLIRNKSELLYKTELCNATLIGIDVGTGLRRVDNVDPTLTTDRNTIIRGLATEYIEEKMEFEGKELEIDLDWFLTGFLDDYERDARNVGRIINRALDSNTDLDPDKKYRFNEQEIIANRDIRSYMRWKLHKFYEDATFRQQYHIIRTESQDGKTTYSCKANQMLPLIVYLQKDEESVALQPDSRK